jgi:hypothetical protein
MGDTDSWCSRNKQGKKELSIHQKIVHHLWHLVSLTIWSYVGAITSIDLIFLPTKVKLVVGTHLYLVKAQINNKLL